MTQANPISLVNFIEETLNDYITLLAVKAEQTKHVQLAIIKREISPHLQLFRHAVSMADSLYRLEVIEPPRSRMTLREIKADCRYL